MSTQPALAALPTPRKLLLASGVLLLIISFLPWYHASVGPFSVSQSGWHQLGTLVWIVLIATLLWESARLARAVPLPERQADLATAAGAALTLVLGVIFVIVRLSDGAIGFALWLGVILMIAFAYAAFQLFQAAGGHAAVRTAQAGIQQRRAAEQTSPPASPPPAQTPTTQQSNPPQDPPADA